MNSHRLRLGLFAAALTVVSTASAQSPEKPVPVVKEPNHVVAFENDFIRLIDVQFPAGKTTLYHVHTIPSVVVELSNATIVTQEYGDAPAAPRTTHPGESRYAPYDEKPLTHRVTNQGPGIFRVLDIELLRRPADVETAPVSAPTDAKLEWEQKRARLFHLELAPRGFRELSASKRAYLLICATGEVDAEIGSATANKIHELKSGDYRYFPPGTRLRINNPTMDATTCVLLELK